MNNAFRVVIFILLATTVGCSGAYVKKDQPAEVIYNEAMTFFEKKNYEDAISAFQELYARYPMSQYASRAKLRIADSHYYDDNYPEAISAYKEFEKLHPTNENIPYAVYQTGMSYFMQILTIDRDQTATRNALAEFERLLSRFPESQYAEDARKKVLTCKNDLAENEFYIGSFYYRKGNYKAAAERLKGAMANYPGFSGMDKVLFYAGKSYIELNERDKGKSLLEKLLNDYPASRFTGEAKVILTSN